MLQQSKSFPAVPDHDSSAWLTSLNHAKARWGDPTCARLKYHAPDKGPWNREIRSFAISVESDDLFKVQKHVGRIHHVHQKLSDSLKLVCKKNKKGSSIPTVSTLCQSLPLFTHSSYPSWIQLQEALIRCTGRRAEAIHRMQLVEKTGNTFKQFEVGCYAHIDNLSAYARQPARGPCWGDRGRAGSKSSRLCCPIGRLSCFSHALPRYSRGRRIIDALYIYIYRYRVNSVDAVVKYISTMQSMNGSSVPLQDSMILGERREILVLGLALAAHNSPSAMAYASVDISVSNPLSSILPRRRSEPSKSIYTNLLTNSYYSPGFAFQHCALGWVWIRGASAQLRISDMIPLNWPAIMTICQLWDSHLR